MRSGICRWWFFFFTSIQRTHRKCWRNVYAIRKLMQKLQSKRFAHFQSVYSWNIIRIQLPTLSQLVKFLVFMLVTVSPFWYTTLSPSAGDSRDRFTSSWRWMDSRKRCWSIFMDSFQITRILSFEISFLGLIFGIPHGSKDGSLAIEVYVLLRAQIFLYTFKMANLCFAILALP